MGRNATRSLLVEPPTLSRPSLSGLNRANVSAFCIPGRKCVGTLSTDNGTLAWLRPPPNSVKLSVREEHVPRTKRR
jgi:hypothetical protein